MRKMFILGLFIFFASCGKGEVVTFKQTEPPEKPMIFVSRDDEIISVALPLPEIVILPIDLTVTRQIHEDIPAFSFQIIGEKRGERREYEDVYIYNRSRIFTLRIFDNDGNLLQEFDELSGTGEWDWRFTHWQHFDENNLWGVRIEDFNFDGYLDIALQYSNGGSLRNEPSFFWFWDNETGPFVKNEFLEDLSLGARINADQETQRILAFCSLYPTDKGVSYYQYIGGIYEHVLSIRFISYDDDDAYVESLEEQDLANETAVTYVPFEYLTVIHRYAEFERNGFTHNDLNSPFLYSYYDNHPILYALYDINGDGVRELIIGTEVGINEIYAMQGDTPVSIMQSHHSPFYISSDMNGRNNINSCTVRMGVCEYIILSIDENGELITLDILWESLPWAIHDDYNTEDGGFLTQEFYRTVDGEQIEIDEEEYRGLLDDYGVWPQRTSVTLEWNRVF